MHEILIKLAHVGFLKVLWIFPVAVTFHEFEEWNIVRWYQQNFVNLPSLTNKGIRAWIVFSSVLGFLWTGIAVLTNDPNMAALVLFVAFALMLQNGFQHIYYFFYFRRYAPGMITSILLLFPTIGYITTRAVQQGYVPLWYIILLSVVLVIPNLFQTVKAGNTIMPSLHAIHRFGDALTKRFRIKESE